MLTNVKYTPTGPVGTLNRLYHADFAGSEAGTDTILLNSNHKLTINSASLTVTNNDGQSKTIEFDTLPDFTLEPEYEVIDALDGDDRFTHIRAYGSDQTGGMVMVDWLEHRAGVTILISDECVILYKTTYGHYAATEDAYELDHGIIFDGLEDITT